MVKVALYKPQIPPNTGNIARLCIGLNGQLLIVGKPSFQMDEKSVRRAGIDYWKNLNLIEYHRWKDFINHNQAQRKIIFTKEGKHHLWDYSFLPEDILIFGNEGYGLPPKVLSDFKESSVRIPMWGEIRSHNLSNSVAIAAYEYMRQLYENKTFVNGKPLTRERSTPYKRNYYQRVRDES